MTKTADPLSEIMCLLSVEEVSWARLEAAGSWALRFPAIRLMKFVRVQQGDCWVIPEGGNPIPLVQDDMLMFLNSPAYVVASAPDVPAVDGMVHFSDHDPVARLNGNDTVLCSVHYTLASENLDLLLRLLPDFYRIPATHSASIGLRRSNDFLHRELQGGEAGSAMMTHHLCEMLLLQTVRAFLAENEDLVPGWLGGLADEQVGRVLAIMHQNPGRSFTLEHLGREAGISRSGLAALFRDKVGMPPLTYLTWWRMQLASRSLKARAQPLATLCRELGYSSESAFGTAFKRHFGVSPARYAREHTHPEGDANPEAGFENRSYS